MCVFICVGCMEKPGSHCAFAITGYPERKERMGGGKVGGRRRRVSVSERVMEKVKLGSTEPCSSRSHTLQQVVLRSVSPMQLIYESQILVNWFFSS